MEPKDIFLVIDSNSLIHRAYYALPPLAVKDGRVVNAVYGFFSILFKSIKDINPDYVIATFDVPKPTFRHKKFKDYKAKRVPSPDDLYAQFPLVKEGLDVFNIMMIEREGFEADDIIGTICDIIAEKKYGEAVILSGDMDILQLISATTKACLLQRSIKEFSLYDGEKVKEKYKGLSSNQLIDFKSLRGDPSDNILGVPGIGEKTAQDLLLKFKTLEGIYKAVDQESESIILAVKKKLVDYRKEAFLSKELVTIKRDVDISRLDLRKNRWGDYDQKKAEDFFMDLNFKSLLKRIEKSKKENSNPNNLSLFDD